MNRGGAKQRYWVGMSREEFLRVCTVRYASSILRTAVRFGVVEPQGCVVCGQPGVGHHHDYSKPLDVIWLCQPHHWAEHQRLGHEHEMSLGDIGISPFLRDICLGFTSANAGAK